MREKNLYAVSLVSIWHWIWGGMLVLIGVLIMFNVQDTYFASDGAPRELTIKAAIVGATTLVFGLTLLIIGAGIWFVRAWAWWTGVVIGAVAFVSDLANFARLSADLSMITDERFAQRVAAWPILMWDEHIAFLGTHQNQLMFVGWPILLHLVITLPVVLFLLAPQVRESFAVGLASGGASAAGSFDSTRVAPVLPSRLAGADDTAVQRPQQRGESLGYLIVQQGPNSGRSFHLGAHTRIGRGHANDIVIEDPSVSRDHAVIRLEDGRFVFNDRGSRNRSYVITSSGKHEVTGRHTLVDGDRLSIGDSVLLFRDGRP